MAASRLYKILLASSTLGVTLLGSPALGLAGPEDGTVTAGNATITQSGLNTSIHQSSDRAIIDWRSFDVNANESVRFYQPGSSSITLNRINDSKASFIDGSVTANGQILILNQNGVVFGANSRVDVAGLVASTGRVNDSAFMSGATTLNFTAGDNQSARIINNGHITARDAGLVGLVAPNVENNGVITAHLGKVTLAGAERFTLDLAGDGLISIDVDGAFNGTAKNTGTIIADGGTIVMTATRARDAVEQSIINTGTLQANSVGVKNGRIILSAGGNRPNAPTRTANATAAIKQAGKIEAKSGAVEVLGDSIHLTETSVIDVSGQAGDGGTINIGGSFQGEPDRPTATWVEVDRGSTTKSNGDIDGNGGTIIFWADRLMTFRGTVEAEGGDESGDGGFVEVSGKNILVYDGHVSTLAAHGKTGTLLLDPTDIVISSAANQAVSGSSPYTPNADNATSILNVTTLRNALTTSSVTVQTRATGTQQGNITVDAAITWTSANTLTLDAHNQIIINQAISGRNITLTADGDVQINAALTGIGTLTIMPKSAGGTIGIGTETGTLQLSTADLANITDGWANIIIGRTNGTGAFNIGAATWNDNLTLRSAGGQMTISGAQALGANNLTISTDSNLALNAALSGSGTLTIMGQSATTSVSTGTGNSGNVNLDNTEITRISDGWSNIVLGSATAQGYLNIGGGTWNDNLTLITYSGNIVVNGVLRMAGDNNLTITATYAPIGIYSSIIMNGAGTLTFSTNSDVALTGTSALTGSGNLIFKTAVTNSNMTLGANAASGVIQLNSGELNRITDGWAKQTYQTSGTGAISVTAYTFKDNVELINDSGTINISGAVNMGANNLTITTNGNPNFASTLAGTGILTIQGNANNTIMNIAGSANNLSIDATELGNILTGWTSVVFGKSNSTGAINIGSYIWQYDTTFKTGSGVITVSGDQVSNAGSMTYETDADMAINANISGSGILTIRGSSDATTMSIAGTGGTLQISAAEAARLQDGWNQIVFGRNTSTGTLIANANTWTDNVQFITGSGLMTVATQTMNSGTNLILTTDSHLALSGAMVGTGGKLTIEGASAATAIGVGTGQTGNIVLDATDLSRLGTSWSEIQIGKATGTGAINLGANSWTQKMTFISRGNITLNGAQTSNLTSGTSLVFASLGGNFVNATGSATPITAGTGSARYLIYSLSAATDTYGTMTAPGAINAKTYFSYGPGAVVETGNRIIYSTGAAKVIYIQIDDKSKVYGDATPTLTWTYLGGLQGSDTLSSAITNSSLTAAGSVVTDNAGTTRSITGSFTTGAGYTVSYTSGTLLVIKAPVTVQAAATSREYGDANPSTFAINYIGLRNGETNSVIDVDAIGSTTATATSGVNTYTITTSGGSDNNYIFNNYTNGVLTVTQATINVTADDKTREYGDANPALTFSYSGFKNNETTSILTSQASVTTAATTLDNVGSYAIIASGAAAANYTFNYIDGSLAITKANLTITAANKTRVYGDSNPALTVSYNGFKNSDTISSLTTQATASTAATSLDNVGNYAITAGGAASDNYSFTYVDGSLAITKALLTITADNKTRIYGDNNPALTVSYNGFKNSDTATSLTTQASAATSATALNNVGNYAITASGAASNNYSFAYVDGSLAITKAVLTITADNKNRIYGDSNPALSVSYNGFKNTDTISSLTTQASAATSATALSNVGNYAITASGAASNNYSFNYVDGSLGITKALLTITADNKNRIYGDNNPALTLSYNGFKNSDTASSLATQASAATSATTLDNVGSYAITASGAASNNYSFAYVDGSLSITKALLTITADNKTRVYGDSNPALTVSYNGFKNSDTATSLTTQAVAATSATNLSNVGNYTITASGAASNNYSFAYVDGSLAITKAALTITADNKTRVYGDNNPALTVSYNGFKNSDTISSLTTQASAATSATALSNVGDYVIAASGAASNNYSFNYVDGSLGITKALLTITADNKTRIYGDNNPALTLSYNGFKNSDTATSLTTQASASTSATSLDNVGNYTIAASGAASNNYSFAYVNGSLAITKALLTITADNKTRVYGDNNPALTVSYNGFKNTDTASSLATQASAATSATILDNVGNYTITASGAASNNYSFAYVDGSLAITKATLTATADNKTRIYGDSNPLLTTTYSGFKNNEDESVINVRATASTTANASSNAGNHVITTAGALDDNYTFAYVDGSLAITKAAVTVTVNDTTRQYGAADPTFSATYVGFKNGENQSVLDTAVVFTPASTTGSNIGTYTITASGAVDTNYSFTFINGNLLITQAALTIQANDQIRLYGEPNPPLTYSINGLRNGDTSAVLSGLSISTPATTSSPTGTYAINIGGATALNYTLSYTNGSLHIVGTMPPPPAPPVTTLPSTAQVTLTTPSITSTGSTGPYNTPQVYTFINSPATLGHEAGSSSATTENGYIAVVYYQNPLQQSLGEPLLFIDPGLYARQDKKETLADFIVH